MEHTEKQRECFASHWIVYRQDDHGNRFVVASQLTRDAAEHLVAVYEQRGHKQHYWIEAKKS